MGWLICFITFIILLLIVVKLYLKLTTGMCRSQVCLVGKTAIVTGANTGIGYEAAIDFAKRGARVILASRDENKSKDAVEKIIRETDNPNVFYKHLDLASLKSVKKFAEEIKKTEPQLDILVNNAGAYGLHGTSEDGLNLEMHTNYFGPFLLTNLLLDLLKKSTPSRIVNVSSLAAKRGTGDTPLNVTNLNEDSPTDMIQYSRSKLCNILFTIELNSKLRGTKVTTYSLHPGVIWTALFHKWLGVEGLLKTLLDIVVKNLCKSPLEGAQTTIYCGVQKGIEGLSGGHFEDCHFVKRYKSADDEGLAKTLWEKTEQILKL